MKHIITTIAMSILVTFGFAQKIINLKQTQK